MEDESCPFKIMAGREGTSRESYNVPSPDADYSMDGQSIKSDVFDRSDSNSTLSASEKDGLETDDQLSTRSGRSASSTPTKQGSATPMEHTPPPGTSRAGSRTGQSAEKKMAQPPGWPVRPGIAWSVGKKVEAMDFQDKWYSSKIMELDDKEKAVLIHFDGWSQRYDEWMSMSSDRIRPLTRHSVRKEKRAAQKAKTLVYAKPYITLEKGDYLAKQEHKVGDNVFAKWTDCRMYAGTVVSINPNGSYDVLFYDGFKKTVQPINVRSMSLEVQMEYAKGGILPDPTKKPRQKMKDIQESLAKLEKNADNEPKKRPPSLSLDGKEIAKDRKAIQGERRSSAGSEKLQTRPPAADQHTPKLTQPPPGAMKAPSSGQKSNRSSPDTSPARKKINLGIGGGAQDVGEGSFGRPNIKKTAPKVPKATPGRGRKRGYQKKGTHLSRKALTTKISGDVTPSTPEVPLDGATVECSVTGEGDRPLPEVVSTLPPTAAGDAGRLDVPSRDSIEDFTLTQIVARKRSISVEVKDVAQGQGQSQAKEQVQDRNLETLQKQIPACDPSQAHTGPPGPPGPPAVTLPPAAKAFCVEEDHNKYKCPYQGCSKAFRKLNLVEYHVKYYHTEEGGLVPPPPARKRKKTISVCSTDSEVSLVGGRVPAGIPPPHAQPPAKKRRDSGVPPGGATTMDVVVANDSVVAEETVKDQAEAEVKSPVAVPGEDPDLKDFLSPDDSMDVDEVMDRLTKEEVVNCICQLNEENGLMIQCDVCLCWQHAACMEISEETLPSKYVCYVCANPPGVRDSARFVHDQDWLKQGGAARFGFLPQETIAPQKAGIMQATHELVADAHGLERALRAARCQLHALKEKTHPEVLFWTKNWDAVIRERRLRELEALEQREVKAAALVAETQVKVEPAELGSPSEVTVKVEPGTSALPPPLSEVKVHSSGEDVVATDIPANVPGALDSVRDGDVHKGEQPTRPDTQGPLDSATEVTDAAGLASKVSPPSPPDNTSRTPSAVPPAASSHSSHVPAITDVVPGTGTTAPPPAAAAESSESPPGISPTRDEGAAEKASTSEVEVPTPRSQSQAAHVPQAEPPSRSSEPPPSGRSVSDNTEMKADVTPSTDGGAVPSDGSEVVLEPSTSVASRVDQHTDLKPSSSGASLSSQDDTAEGVKVVPVTVITDPYKDCEGHLLERVSSVQDSVEEHLDLLEEQVSALESAEDTGYRSGDILRDMSRVKKSIHQLLKDLSKVKRMALYR